MRYSVLRLIAIMTASCVALALVRHGLAALICVGVSLLLVVWELVQFGRELNR